MEDFSVDQEKESPIINNPLSTSLQASGNKIFEYIILFNLIFPE